MVNLIKIENLTFRYDSREQAAWVLKDINLSIKKGEFVAVVGPNGCGKSTLVRHLNGLLIPNAGSVTVAGLETKEPRNHPVIRRMVGMVFQNPDNQLFASVVEEDVAFGLENLCLPRAEIRDRVEQALGRLDMLKYRSYPPHRLSGGQKQKVAIAGVLAMRCDCIVLDEPTSMLDPRGRQEVMEALKDLNAGQGITVVHVTHDMTEALFFPRVIAISGGRIVFDGSPDSLFTSVDIMREAGLRAPEITALVNSLIKAGVPLPRRINTPQELVDALCL